MVNFSPDAEAIGAFLLSGKEADVHLPKMSVRVTEKIKSELRSYGRIAKFVQLLVGVGFGIPEGILINLATGASGPAQARFYTWLAVIAVFHVTFFLVTLLSTAPLPEFLVEFNQGAERLREAEAQVSAYSSFMDTYNAATIATQLCLSAVEARRLAPRSKLELVLDEVMAPWVEGRTEIFRFHNGSALYNFAIFEYFEQEKVLKVRWRNHDNRMKIRNRTWEPGSGHVGVCFQRTKTLFSDDASAAGDDNPITTETPDDKKQYRSMLSTPIYVDGNKTGVFVVTSSEPFQFDKELHSRIAEVIALLIGQAIKHGWTRSR